MNNDDKIMMLKIITVLYLGLELKSDHMMREESLITKGLSILQSLETYSINKLKYRIVLCYYGVIYIHVLRNN